LVFWQDRITMKHIVRVAAIAAACWLGSVSAAHADPGASFPMSANAYRPGLQRRVDAVWAKIEKKLDAHSVSAERKKEIRGMLDDAAKELWAAYATAAADGNISQEEHRRLNAIALGLRAKVRARMAAARTSPGDGGSASERDTSKRAARSTHAPGDPSPPATSRPKRGSKAPVPSSAPKKPSKPAGHPATAPSGKPSSKHREHPTSGVVRPPGADESGE